MLLATLEKKAVKTENKVFSKLNFNKQQMIRLFFSFTSIFQMQSGQ